MKAVIYTKYGQPEVLQLKDIPKPVPKDNEVLVKIYTTTAHIGDFRMRSFTVPPLYWIPFRIYLGIFGPRRKILGLELAGEIEAVGKDVKLFKKGDRVLASTFAVNFGGYAEYKCFPEDGMLIMKPDSITYEQAAAIPGAGMTALRCIRKGKIKPEQKILIYGASGSVGTLAVQLARHFGAEVTGVCSTANLELVKSLGADKVIDYTREDFSREGKVYDVVFDTVAKISSSRGKKALKKGGIYLNVMSSSGYGERKEELISITKLIASGEIQPVIDRTYPLEQIVEAHRYLDKGHKKGNVVITVYQEEKEQK